MGFWDETRQKLVCSDFLESSASCVGKAAVCRHVGVSGFPAEVSTEDDVAFRISEPRMYGKA